MAHHPRTPEALDFPLLLDTKPHAAESPSDGPGWVRWSSSLSDHESSESLASAISLEALPLKVLNPLSLVPGEAQVPAPVPPPRRGSLRASQSYGHVLDRLDEQELETESWIRPDSSSLQLGQPLPTSDKRLDSEETPFVTGDSAQHHSRHSTPSKAPLRCVGGPVKRFSLTLNWKHKRASSSAEGRGMDFWLAFTAVFLSTFLSAVNFMIIAPIISSIAADMPPSKISPVWLASTSLATSISFLPLFRGLADAIDRGKALVSALMVFLVGSFVACLAHSMLDLVIGRGMQGLGGGGMLLIGQLVMSDLTTPSECGYFLGHVWLAFGLAAIVAPIAGGWFATFDWRWAFYIDVPLGVIALLLLWPAQLAKPKLPLHEKIRRLDFVGSIVLFGSTIALLFGLIDGGVYGLWTSASVWGSIVIGGAGVILFCVLETVPSPLVRDPILPAWLFRHRSSVIAYLLTFFHGFLFFGALQGLVIYFQVRQATPLRAAIDTLPLSVPLVPAAFITSMLTALTGRYKGSITACQALMTLSFLSFICMDPETLTRDWALYQVIGGIGLGGLHSLTFPVTCAAMPAEELAQAIGASVFVHSLGALWGVSSVLIAFQSQAGQRLVQIAGAANVGIDRGNVISFVSRLYGLPDSLREPLSEGYQKAIRVGFIVLAPFALAGFVASLFIKQVPLLDYNQAEDIRSIHNTTGPRATHHQSMVEDEKEFESTSGDTLAPDSFHMSTFDSQSSLSQSGSWSEFPAGYDFKSPNVEGPGHLALYPEYEASAPRPTLSFPAAAHVKSPASAMCKESPGTEEQYALLQGESEGGNGALTLRLSCDSVERTGLSF